ncbi:MAG TPA: hypothetical protein VER76_06705 [Pyrinomonadaceae bacterium]|nr:hypothetical protein [Pyrinomonadaceae bacterium]
MSKPFYDYTFKINLLTVFDINEGVQVWDSGTLTLTSPDYDNATGTIVTDRYKDTIKIVGESSRSDVGTMVKGGGYSSEARVSFVLNFIWDGHFQQDTLLSGMINLQDLVNRVSYTFILQGFSLQKP